MNGIYSFIQMCKSKQQETETVDNTNYGLLNISEAGIGKMGLGEILMIVLLLIVLGMVLVYYCKRKKQQRLRELDSAMRNGLAYRPANSEVYPHRQAIPLPIVQFSTPGQRTVSLQQEEPSAPAQGLWEQCR